MKSFTRTLAALATITSSLALACGGGETTNNYYLSPSASTSVVYVTPPAPTATATADAAVVPPPVDATPDETSVPDTATEATPDAEVVDTLVADTGTADTSVEDTSTDDADATTDEVSVDSDRVDTTIADASDETISSDSASDATPEAATDASDEAGDATTVTAKVTRTRTYGSEAAPLMVLRGRQTARMMNTDVQNTSDITIKLNRLRYRVEAMNPYPTMKCRITGTKGAGHVARITVSEFLMGAVYREISTAFGSTSSGEITIEVNRTLAKGEVANFESMVSYPVISGDVPAEYLFCHYQLIMLPFKDGDIDGVSVTELGTNAELTSTAEIRPPAATVAIGDGVLASGKVDPTKPATVLPLRLFIAEWMQFAKVKAFNLRAQTALHGVPECGFGTACRFTNTASIVNRLTVTLGDEIKSLGVGGYILTDGPRVGGATVVGVDTIYNQWDTRKFMVHAEFTAGARPGDLLAVGASVIDVGTLIELEDEFSQPVTEYITPNLEAQVDSASPTIAWEIGDIVTTK